MLAHLNSWLGYNEHNKGYTQSTGYNYRRAVEAFERWVVEQKLDYRTLSPEQLQRFCGEVLHLRGQSPSTRRVSVSALRGFYKWLAARRLVPADPAQALPFPKMGRSLPLPIPADDVSKLMAQADLSTFKGVRDLAILSVLCGCGPRVSGVSALNEGDLIFGMGETGLEELTLRLREKGKHERYVPAPEDVRVMLRAYLGHPELDAVDRRLPEGDRVLFINLTHGHVPAHERRGEARRLTQWSIHRMIVEYGETAGVAPRFLHPHAFRHLYGQELAEHDVDLLLRQSLMGHRDPKSAAIYSHIAVRKLRAAATQANPLKRVKHPAAGLAAVLASAAGRATRPAAPLAR